MRHMTGVAVLRRMTFVAFAIAALALFYVVPASASSASGRVVAGNDGGHGGGSGGHPGSSTPGSSHPGSSAPGSSTPGSSIPGSSTPGSSTPGSSTPGSSTTLPGAGCDQYTPTQVAVSSPSVEAGDDITVTGIAVAGDTVTVTLSGASIGEVVLGSAVAGAGGQFSVTGTVPAAATPGDYTITVTSTLCPSSTTITISVTAVVDSGCGGSSASRTLTQGSHVNWSLHAPSFSSAFPVKLTTSLGSYSAVLYNGPWPSGDVASIVIPMNAPVGKHTMTQDGTKSNGKGSMSKTCPYWVVAAPAAVLAAGLVAPDAPRVVDPGGAVLSETASRSALAFTGGTPIGVFGVVLLAVGYGLLRLRFRDSRSRRS